MVVLDQPVSDISPSEPVSKEKLESYYKELSTILTKYNLHDKPEHIFNVDETGVTTEHSPPKIVLNLLQHLLKIQDSIFFPKIRNTEAKSCLWHFHSYDSHCR
jgi:hypothetical protein